MDTNALVELTGQLVLARLLVPTKRPPTAAAVRKDVTALLAHRLTAADAARTFDHAIDRLESSRLITRKPLALSDQGRRQAQQWLGLSGLPEKLSWGDMKKTFLAAKALGNRPADTAPGLKKSSTIQAAVVARRYHLPEGTDSEAALHRLAWRQLGVESDQPFKLETVLARWIGLHRTPTKAQLKTQLANQAVAAKKAAELHDGAIRRWLIDATLDGGAAAQPPAAAPTPVADATASLAEFARAVLAAARASQAGWFGGQKIFISHVFEQWRRQHPAAGGNIAQFKQKLVDTHRQGLLQLSRADLVEGLDPADLAASETKYLNAVFHYIRVEPKESPDAADRGS